MVHSWSLPETLSKDSKRLKVIKYACGRNGKQSCSSLTLSRTQATDTGNYSCKYPTSPAKKKKESTVYVFINGKITFFNTSWYLHFNTAKWTNKAVQGFE